MSSLKPCPFCGGSDRVRSVAYGGTPFDPDDPPWHVGCSVCDAGVDGVTEAEAIASWNTRAPIPVTDDDAYDWQAKDEGANFVLGALAQILGVDTWVQEDGSETWDGDVWGTLRNILSEGKVLDQDEGVVARLNPPVTDEMVERAMVGAAIQQGTSAETLAQEMADDPETATDVRNMMRAAITAALGDTK